MSYIYCNGCACKLINYIVHIERALGADLGFLEGGRGGTNLYSGDVLQYHKACWN